MYIRLNFRILLLRKMTEKFSLYFSLLLRVFYFQFFLRGTLILNFVPKVDRIGSGIVLVIPFSHSCNCIFFSFLLSISSKWQARQLGELPHKQCPAHRKTEKQQPVRNPFRCGAIATYHDEYPRNFSPHIACTVNG